MNRPYRNIVIAHHLIWTAYGWWLPNDPRGSMSRTVAYDVLAEVGELHYGRREVQPAGWEIRDFYDRAKDVLQYDLLTFTPEEVAIIGESFGKMCNARPYTCYACATMTDHSHVLLRKHRRSAEQMIVDLQEASRDALGGLPHRKDHPVWGGPGWKVFLRTGDDIGRTIRYIGDNPVKMRRPKQRWDFVKEYDGWPLHKKKQ